MQRYIHRQIEREIMRNLRNFPIVAILGPRQCGKSTLAAELGKKIKNFLYLDLELPSDERKLNDPELFFNANQDKTICIDEIQLKPRLFSVLRGIIDKNRRNGRFLVLGSASPALLQNSSETLAGRIVFSELTPFTLSEAKHVKNFNENNFWLKGGYPESFLSKTLGTSVLWRNNFIKTFVERDIPQSHIRIPSTRVKRFLRICSHFHGQLLNLQKIGQSLGVSYNTVKTYIDIFEQNFIFRLLEPLEANLKKRLVKSPKLYFRDSGLLHSLLEIDNSNQLLGHPSAGASWEGFLLENIITELPGWRWNFYQTSSGNEIDLILEKGRKRIAVEFKLSTSPDVSKGFWLVLRDLKIDQAWIIAPVEHKYQLKKNVFVSNISDFLTEFS